MMSRMQDDSCGPEESAGVSALWEQLFALCAETPESVARALDLLGDSSLAVNPIRMIQSIPQVAAPLLPVLSYQQHQIVV